jgi:Glucodextranase, domain N
LAPFFAPFDAPLSRQLTKFPAFSQLAGNFGSETGSLETASSSGESANFRSRRRFHACRYGRKHEVYCPRVDIPQIRDLGFIIADGEGFWAEVKRVANYRMRLLAPGVPAVEIVHQHERYSLRLRIAPDARRDVLAIECRLDGDPKLRVYALLAPHLGATGYGNRAAIVLYRRRWI